MFDDSILEPIRKAIHEAKQDGENILKIHVTYDFYMKVKAKCTPPFPDTQKPFEYPILGYSVVEHIEPCKKEWWFEFEGESSQGDYYDFVDLATENVISSMKPRFAYLPSRFKKMLARKLISWLGQYLQDDNKTVL